MGNKSRLRWTHWTLWIWRRSPRKTDERGAIFLDVLMSIMLMLIINSVIWSTVMSTWHSYDQSSRQLAAYEQVSVFFRQLKEEVEQSTQILVSSSTLHLVLTTGEIIDYRYNSAPAAQHIIRLINGRGGEVACAYVKNVVFRKEGAKIVYVSLDVENNGFPTQFEGFANVKIS